MVENHTVTFFCYADGTPFPSITWFKGDVPLLDMQHLYVQELAGGREFKIRNVQIGDAGLYECRAKNDAGLKKKQFLVNVLGSHVTSFLINFCQSFKTCFFLSSSKNV